LPEPFGIGVVEASLIKWWNLFIAAMKRMAGNQELFLAHELLPFTRYVPDLARLSAHKDRIVLAVGHDTRELLAGELAYRPAAWLAERLGTQVVDFPGDHGGYW
jgi:hypothetical protein